MSKTKSETAVYVCCWKN